MLKEENNIVDGIIWKEVLIFFIPLVIGAFFQHFYTIVDTIIVGNALGVVALSAVGGSASKLIVMLINFFVGVSSGITAYASRYYGQKDYRMLKSILFNGTVMFFVFGIILSIIGIVFSNDFLLIMNTPAETLKLSNVYLKTYLFGLVFCVMYNTFAGMLRAIGDAKTPLYVLIFCSFINIALDIIFVLLLNMGVFGVAFATTLSQFASAVILGLFILKSLKNTQKIKLYIDFSVMKDISKIGVPAGVQSIMFSLSNMVVQSGVNSFGTLNVAAWTSYCRIDSIVDIFVSSLGSTAIVFVGQNYGANKFDRVKKSVKQIMGISYVIVGFVVFGFILNRTALISLFTNDTEVVALASQIICIVLPMYLLNIPQQVFSQSLRGLGISFTPMLLTLVGVVGLRFIWVLYLLPLNPTFNFLALCYPVSALLMSGIFFVYYLIVIKKIEKNAI